ncbi:MAG: WxcM-like domain-containing protein [Roseateles sp.]|jgi:UDP-2-acetamido-3-amino-2,3-dideoxy-glucuronate N-acetyltransferase|nr:isomerase [Methylibium sp.]MBY0365669.1 WxcM-like domain-containing protein [Burkholderiaceae bacterium]|mmetsp:Transcript_1263/g.3669  ORF Transcript_1263/g.3669 Transcript_1263/m.3669 type:complete len:247 (+) Transcript_1263:252-992(+)
MNNIMGGAIVDSSANMADDVQIGYNAVVLSEDKPGRQTRVMNGVRIGANATIYPGVVLGQGAHVLPGAVVKQSVPPLAIVDGNPATIVGYENTTNFKPAVAHAAPRRAREPSTVKGVELYSFADIKDLRGNLTVGEFEKQIPFQPKRYFLVYGVPTEETRGEHAHLACHQFLIAVHGSVNVIADDGTTREEFVLDRNSIGLYLPPMTWGIQYRYSADAVLLVFASDFYDPADYIRDYSDFLRTARK